MATAAPARCSISAIAAPRPWLAPVTIAVRPLRSMAIIASPAGVDGGVAGCAGSSGSGGSCRHHTDPAVAKIEPGDRQELGTVPTTANCSASRSVKLFLPRIGRPRIIRGMGTPPRVGTRYREIADRLERSLRGGAYSAGQRLPSVRMLCRNWQASITTVVAAYHLLERRGLVETRAQSGHYARPPSSAPEPEAVRGRLVPTDVGLGQLALMVMKDALDPRLVPFGPAMPDPELLPSAEIHRLIAPIGRDPASCTDRSALPPGARERRLAIARRAPRVG